MINYPVLFVSIVEHYLFIQRLFAKIGVTWLPKEKHAKTSRLLHDRVTGNGTLAPEEWAWENGRLRASTKATP